MTHLIQPATSARAKCRGCGALIAVGDLRFGEVVPNPYAEGETTHWFHLDCAAYKRPEPFLEAVNASTERLADRERLALEAQRGIDCRRLPRANGAEHSPSNRAHCRSCRSHIEKGSWRISLVYYEGGRFQPSGFIHAGCARAYFETIDLLARLTHFSPDLSDEDIGELRAELEGSASPAPPARDDEPQRAEIRRASGRPNE